MAVVLNRPGDYLDGRWVVAPSPDDELLIDSPADLDDRVGVHPVSLAHVDEAVAAARRAQPAWDRQGQDARAALLRRYQDRLRKHRDALVDSIAREAGKALWDAEAEVNAMIGKVDLVLGEGATWTADRTIDDLPGAIRWRPLGVVAVVGPFNFPGHLPNGQILPALLLGNTVVFKPSEKTPGAAVWMARCFTEAGLPPGVFNLVQGAAPTAERLTTHDDIDGVLFTGSAEVGQRIAAANAHRPGVLVALELGGKNASIVLDDADVDHAAEQIAFAAYASTGQRCTATSRLYATREVADALVDALARAARGKRVGHPFDPGIFMGPMITHEARQALLDAQARAVAAGFEPVVPGAPVEIPDHRGHYVRPSVHRAPHPDPHVGGYTHDELFGPDVAIYPVDDLDHAIALTNATRYGLVASVFTADEHAFTHAAAELRVGIVHLNRATAGASGRLPFGGIKDSGNHRPAGITAGLLCAYPQAILGSRA
jgi:succinylglutamic semialdehyde dehydrogenase